MVLEEMTTPLKVSDRKEVTNCQNFCKVTKKSQEAESRKSRYRKVWARWGAIPIQLGALSRILCSQNPVFQSTRKEEAMHAQYSKRSGLILHYGIGETEGAILLMNLILEYERIGRDASQLYIPFLEMGHEALIHNLLHGTVRRT